MESILRLAILSVFLLLIWMKIAFGQPGLYPEIASDVILVIILLAFGERILSAIFQWPVYWIAKTIQYIKIKTINR